MGGERNVDLISRVAELSKSLRNVWAEVPLAKFLFLLFTIPEWKLARQ